MGASTGTLSRPWWTGVGVITASLLAVVGIIVTMRGVGASQSPSDGSAPSATSPASQQPAPPSADVASPASQPLTGESSPESAAPMPPRTLYLLNLDSDAIIQSPHWVSAHTGPASIAGVSYPNSLSYEFENCSSCTESLEFIVPSGVFGLSDSSRHDDVIDGVTYFAIYDAAGNQLVSPQRIEYPQAIPVDLDISGQPRIRIEMSEGTNYEEFVLGDAALQRSDS
jgi:hypothetical protein